MIHFVMLHASTQNKSNNNQLMEKMTKKFICVTKTENEKNIIKRMI
jgi:hypothetical protein